MKPTISIIGSILLIFFFISLIKCSLNKKKQLSHTKPTFVGSKTCVECHKKEFDDWVGSDHQLAMDTANAKSVVADFNNTTHAFKGFTSKFYKKGNKFYVYTQGPEGKPEEYEIAYTFGVRPLQQYVIAFDKGRFQLLPIAWDVQTNSWYHMGETVYEDLEIKHDDWLYWTNNGQNWNGMCVECHTTNYHKGYNPETHEFNSTYSEINVSCEACHGPASIHNEWATIVEEDRPEIANSGFFVKQKNLNTEEMLDQCAYCHSRRSGLGDNKHTGNSYMDQFIPQLGKAPYFHIDGQILEEDYVFASFTQSKMHNEHVRCADCHDIHGLKLKKDGNGVCYQCHTEEKYASYGHHFHKGDKMKGLLSNNGVYEIGNGTQCVDCHMTGAKFMGVDFRRDHSIRIPRPDLTRTIGTPNACKGCHSDEKPEWAEKHIKDWYKHEPPLHYGTVFAAAEKFEPGVDRQLSKLVQNDSSSNMVKSIAISYLSNYQAEQNSKVIENELNNNNPMIRYTAISNYFHPNREYYIDKIKGLLLDSIKSIRIEASQKLLEIPNVQVGKDYEKPYNDALAEYIAYLNHSSDFAGSRHNSGNLYQNLKQYNRAVKEYKEAIRIDKFFIPAYINLAILYSQIKQIDKAESVLLSLINTGESGYEGYYYLGLIKSEKNKFNEAIKYLLKAAEINPNMSRIYYNLGLLYHKTGKKTKAENALKKAISISPGNLDYLHALNYFYTQEKQLKKAELIAKQINEIKYNRK
ncbi:MAG: hypothetical protein B6I20_02465 [Bacteroidetes bacterium 4572_117]|nr:MAG: hypothetical protein B6I20_02465 [Bacteroidetes bacterium 4572_117]